MKVIKAPMKFTPLKRKSVFLAGSIEMGKAQNWQEIVTNALADLDIVVLNPRRDDWDSSWVQSIKDKQFNEQVTWELDAQAAVSYIFMYFAPECRGPISLLELGLYSGWGKQIVCCPDGFWRKGNVEIVCDRFRIPFYEEIEPAIMFLREMLCYIVNKEAPCDEQ